MDCSLPGSSLHGILQARIQDVSQFPSLGNLPDPGIEPVSPALQVDSLTSEPPTVADICTSPSQKDDHSLVFSLEQKGRESSHQFLLALERIVVRHRYMLN